MFKKLNSLLESVRLLGVAVALLLVFGTAGAARASDHYRDCQKRIDHEQRDLDRAIARHGERSRQTDHERRELDRLYRECRFR